MLGYMANIDDKPLTIKAVHDVLIPAMEKVFVTKEELEAHLTKREHRLQRIILNFLREHEILPQQQLEEIDELEV